LSLICASHTPLMDRIAIAPDVEAQVRHAYTRLANHVRAFAPDLIVQFAPDHYQGFFHQLMPSFCVGTAARSAADWSIAAGRLSVPEIEAKSLVRWLVDDEFDVAVSRDMVVDHGFLQMWQEMFGEFTALPLIPVFINCVASPVPTYRRIRLLGESIGRFALQTGKRVLIVASGGLSHDPPVPDVDGVPAEVRERLIRGTPRSASERAIHEERLTEFGRQAAKGEGPCQPLNPDWDRAFLDIIADGQLAAFDTFKEDDVRNTAGRAGNEVLAWVAAASAFSAAGPYDTTIEFYHPIPEWIAGMAMITANTRT
jgi:2,3-dihydroxyphenylpropionate 1,2-dioxygenase